MLQESGVHPWQSTVFFYFSDCVQGAPGAKRDEEEEEEEEEEEQRFANLCQNRPTAAIN